MNISGTNVAAAIVPFTTEDTYPTHDAQYGKGGWREVDTIEERDAIPDKRKSIGMAVYVREEAALYILETTGWDKKELDRAKALPVWTTI